MQYKSLIVVMAIFIQDYSQAMQLDEIQENSVSHVQQDAIKLPLHAIILNQIFTPQEKIRMMQAALKNQDLQLDINAQDENGRTALNLATYYKADPIIVQFLIVNKANINEPDRFNESPLHNAIRNEEIFIAKMLLDAGANVELKNDNELTPIDLARSSKTQALFGFE